MSQENVEVVRAVFEAGTRGTWTPFGMYDRDVIVRPQRLAGAGAVRRSRAVMRQFGAASRDLRRRRLELSATSSTLATGLR